VSNWARRLEMPGHDEKPPRRAVENGPAEGLNLSGRIVPGLPKLWLGGLSHLVVLLCDCP
jgi:hypothetical protein